MISSYGTNVQGNFENTKSFLGLFRFCGNSNYFYRKFILVIDIYKDKFEDFLIEKTKFGAPKSLYEPVSYILSLGGKKLRPILALMSADLFGESIDKAMHAALAVEVFHNFTLVHDDIMDDAPLRRGKVTVHEKWDVNTGILSGDAMLILAYQYLEVYEPHQLKDLLQLFSKTALEVCEGQQYDVDFEDRDDVTIEEYIKMISLKTSVLVGAALKMGAIVANASQSDADLIYDFGLNLGVAFQLQDDFLDAFGDPKTFGKQVGGDIIENKKTYLYIKAKELATDLQAKRLSELFSGIDIDDEVKVEEVKSIFVESKASELIREEIKKYTHKAFTVLDQMNLDLSKVQVLKSFGENLMNRNV